MSEIKEYFTIGEMSKLHNITVETLRHYDRYGILKPSYINEKTGYRYYSMDDFNRIDLIKQCKALNIPLNEIKDIIDNYTSLDSILEIMQKQKQIIKKKITELESIKYNIKCIEKGIKETQSHGLNTVFIKYNPERKFVTYDYTDRYAYEFEMNLRSSLVDMELNYNSYNSQIAFSVAYNEEINTDKLNYNRTMIKIENEIIKNEENIYTIEEGNYLTLYFDDDYHDALKYHNIFKEYIKENNIKIVSDIYEIYLITRVGNNGQRKSLAHIEAKIEI